MFAQKKYKEMKIKKKKVLLSKNDKKKIYPFF